KVIRVTHGFGRPYWDYYSSDEQYTLPNAQLVLEARDKEGKSGVYSEEIGADLDAEYIRVRTNHTLYHPGDPIEAEIATTAKVNEAIANVWSAEGLLRSLVVKLSDGHGKIK